MPKTAAEFEVLVNQLVHEAAVVGTARSGLVIDPVGADNSYLLEVRRKIFKAYQEALDAQK